MSRRINFLDAPDHPRVRGLVSKAFTPRRVNNLRPWLETTAQRLVGELEVTSGCVEIMHGIAHQLPSLVISELLGVPAELRDELTVLSDQITPIFSPLVSESERTAAVTAAEQMHAILKTEIEGRRTDRRDDLLTALLAVEADGLSRAELMSLVATLYSAGHRTTRDLFGNGLELLLNLEVPVADAVVDEVARLATPTHYVARFAAEDVEVGGEVVSAGTLIMVFLAAANRDPLSYDQPDEYNPARVGKPALSFAVGPHFCLGASLARMEVEVMFAAVAARFPEARASDRQRRWHQRGPFRGLDELFIRVD
jgi:cytochrome P450